MNTYKNIIAAFSLAVAMSGLSHILTKNFAETEQQRLTNEVELLKISLEKCRASAQKEQSKNHECLEIPLSEGEEQTLGDKIFGSGECFEYDPSKGVAKAMLAYGGAICVASIPEVAITRTNGCHVTFTGRGVISSMLDVVRPGETFTFSARGKKINLVLGCRKETNQYVYIVKLYPADA